MFLFLRGWVRRNRLRCLHRARKSPLRLGEATVRARAPKPNQPTSEAGRAPEKIKREPPPFPFIHLFSFADSKGEKRRERGRRSFCRQSPPLTPSFVPFLLCFLKGPSLPPRSLSLIDRILRLELKRALLLSFSFFHLPWGVAVVGFLSYGAAKSGNRALGCRGKEGKTALPLALFTLGFRLQFAALANKTPKECYRTAYLHKTYAVL